MNSTETLTLHNSTIENNKQSNNKNPKEALDSLWFRANGLWRNTVLLRATPLTDEDEIQSIFNNLREIESETVAVLQMIRETKALSRKERKQLDQHIQRRTRFTNKEGKPSLPESVLFTFNQEINKTLEEGTKLLNNEDKKISRLQRIWVSLTHRRNELAK